MAAALPALLGLVAFYVRLAPWLALPDEPAASVEARFRAAVPEPEIPTTVRSTPVDAALDRMKGSSLPLDPELAFIDPDRLSDDERRALELLEAWHAAGGPLNPRRCGEMGTSVVEQLRLARLGLQTADAGAEARVLAVARLGAQMREHGLLVETSLGFTVAQLTAAWSRARRAPLGPAFAPHRPRLAQMRDALARDAACSARLLQLLVEGVSFERRARLHDGAEWPPLGIVWSRREKLVTKKYFADVLAAAASGGDDAEATARAIERVDAGRPKSVTLSALQIAAPLLVRKAGDACRDVAGATAVP